MAEIPADVIAEILLLLPVVDLARFRCVSKKWRKLIDSPDFIKSHLNFSTKAHSDSVMIFYENPSAYYVDFDSVCNSSGSSLPILKEVTKPWGVDLSNHFGVVGICNGLLCICTSDLGVVLWNPLMRKHVQVPQPQHHDIVVPWCWGFGYDSDSDDFKVVTMAYSSSSNDGGSGRFVVWVYSLKYGVWKSIGYFPYFLLGFRKERRCVRGLRQLGAFVNGALHWRVRPHYSDERDGSDLIAALDLGKLEYSLVPQPDYIYRDNNIGKDFRLGVLDGCLCATSYDARCDGFDLWVMKEYGVKESWTRLIACTGCASPLIPLAYSENGDELLFVTDSNVILRYELKTRSFKRMIPCWSPDLGKPLVYIPSLVCP